jgi:hypothetical protein
VSAPKKLTPASNSASYPTIKQLDRRAFLVGAGSVAVAAGLTSCGPGEALAGLMVMPEDPPDAANVPQDIGGGPPLPRQDASYVPEDTGGAGVPYPPDASQTPLDAGGVAPADAALPDGGDEPDGGTPEVP